MKIALIGNSDHCIYNYRYELVQRLLHDGHKLFVIAPPGDHAADLRRMGCEYIEVEMSCHGTNPIEDLKLKKTFCKLLKKILPDYVFTYTIKPNIYGALACRKLKTPCIANITGLGTAVENGGLLQAVTVMLYRHAFRRVQTVFFQNRENMKFFLDRGICRGKEKLLPGSGVNLHRFHPYPYPEGGTISFVFISRLMKEKGVDQYLEAAEFIRAKYPGTEFHICGGCEPAYEEKVKDLQARGVVIYHGLVSSIEEVLKDMNCTVHPTYYPEGLSNVLLESCACARPIITTDRPGCKEVIDDGINGYIVKQKDSADLIEKIEKFLSIGREKQEQMGLAGRAKVEREFDREIVIRKYLDELKPKGNA